MRRCECYSAKEVSRHSSVNDAWVIVDSQVFDITSFLNTHPGGIPVTEQYLGKDISNILHSSEVHKHSSAAFEMLREFKIGTLLTTDGNEGSNYAKLLSRTWEEEKVMDWSKPVLYQIPGLVAIYDEWVHIPVNKNLRLFQSDFVEFFSKSPWWLIPSVWVPVIVYFTCLSMIGGPPLLPWIKQTPVLSVAECISYLAVGMFVWTFLEYFLHRFIFHQVPPPTASKIHFLLHFILHGQHHKVPHDRFRLVFPPIPAAIIVLLIYLPAINLVPLSVGRAVFAGGLAGYVSYDLTHYYLHHGSPTPKSYFSSLKSYHLAHHYINHNLGFGISSKLWDLVFNTVLQ